LIAIEILNEHGYAPSGDSAFTIGEYVTGDPVAGIRNYNVRAAEFQAFSQ
jgi:extracellular elastinolytic metalloproteinase